MVQTEGGHTSKPTCFVLVPSDGCPGAASQELFLGSMMKRLGSRGMSCTEWRGAAPLLEKVGGQLPSLPPHSHPTKTASQVNYIQTI